MRSGGRYAALALAVILATLPPLGSSSAKSKAKSRSSSSIAAAIVVDMNTGRVLHEQSADVRRHPASLTKMMTLYMLFSYMRAGTITFDSELVVTPFAARQSPTKLSVKPGTTIKTSDAINALVTLSANDVAVTVAENLAGTEENFARLMTTKARALGMTSTVFRNASGLPNDEQVTTARDMAILSQRLIKDFPEFYGCFETKYFTYRGRKYRNHNRLLFGYKGTDGIKTGFTRAAGFNLAASVRRDDKHLVAVVLGGRTGASRDAAMRSLLDRTFPKAIAAKSSRGTKVADAPPPIPARKRVFTVAGVSAVEPISYSNEDVAAHAATGRGAARPPSPVSGRSASSSAAGKTPGPFHVQVGAYTSAPEAEKRLGDVRAKAGSLLEGHAPVTMIFEKDETQWYRARFAGFSQDAARSACKALKRMSVDCVVMRAN